MAFRNETYQLHIRCFGSMFRVVYLPTKAFDIPDPLRPSRRVGLLICHGYLMQLVQRC